MYMWSIVYYSMYRNGYIKETAIDISSDQWLTNRTSEEKKSVGLILIFLFVVNRLIPRRTGVERNFILIELPLYIWKVLIPISLLRKGLGSILSWEIIGIWAEGRARTNPKWCFDELLWVNSTKSTWIRNWR